MSAAYTPGPWFPVNDGSDDEPMMVVKASRIAGQPPMHTVAICCTGDSPQPMEDANALLIASAPDMLAALREVLTLLNDPDADGTDANRVERQINAAIQKATGDAT